MRYKWTGRKSTSVNKKRKKIKRDHSVRIKQTEQAAFSYVNRRFNSLAPLFQKRSLDYLYMPNGMGIGSRISAAFLRSKNG